MSEKLKFTVTYIKTINLGNYESVKIGLSMDYHQGGLRVSTAFKEVESYVESMIEESLR